MHTVFIVEDDRQIDRELGVLLERNGYAAMHAADFASVPDEVNAALPDLVLLDLNLPNVDGHVICKQFAAPAQCRLLWLPAATATLTSWLA
jgi:DNA-binding response OmpR family regulator